VRCALGPARQFSLTATDVGLDSRRFIIVSRSTLKKARREEREEEAVCVGYPTCPVFPPNSLLFTNTRTVPIDTTYGSQSPCQVGKEEGGGSRSSTKGKTGMCPSCVMSQIYLEGCSRWASFDVLTGCTRPS
jgi:hypothetical protein